MPKASNALRSTSYLTRWAKFRSRSFTPSGLPLQDYLRDAYTDIA